MPGGGCALPGLRSYDLPLIYSPLLLKLPVLTASKSLRHSRKAVAVSRGPRKRSAAGRSGSVPVVVPDGGINALSGLQEHTTRGPHRSLRQRRANVAYTGVTLGLLRLARPAMKQRVQQDRPEGGRANPAQRKAAQRQREIAGAQHRGSPTP